MKFEILLLLIAVSATTAQKSFKNYKVYNVVPETEEHVLSLVGLQDSKGIDFWTDLVDVGQVVRIMVAPEEQDSFLDLMHKWKISSEMTIEDVQKLIDDQMRPAEKGARNVETFGWNRYYNVTEIYDWLDKLEYDYPNIVTVVTIGRSNEGKEIKGVKIDYKPEGREKTLIGMYEGTIHAREWISPASLTWIINEFLTSSDREVRFLAEHFVWYIFPVTNPDGYDYTFTENRMWRKNRNTAYARSCEVGDDMSNGIDLNRNFGFLWMLTGASSDPCSNTFAGPSAYSEPETRAIVNFVNTLKTQGELVYYIAFHSFTQLILVPYSHVPNNAIGQTEDFLSLFEIAGRGAARLEKRHGTQYRYGASPNVMYAMSGTSFDWARGEAKIPLSFLFELRDMGEYGFLLPADQIVPTSEELMDALCEMDIAARELGYYSGKYLRSKQAGETSENRRSPFPIDPLSLRGVMNALPASCVKAQIRYDEYKVFSVVPETEDQIQALKDLSQELLYEFWTDFLDVGKNVKIMVAPNRVKDFYSSLNSIGLRPDLNINNVQQLIDAQLKRPYNGRNTNSFGWNHYHNLEEIYDWLDGLADTYPDVVTVVVMGHSNAQREIKGVIIDFNKKGNESAIAMIEGGIHAREWISPATVTWLINEFLTSNDPEIRFLAEALVWHLFPVTNPDGYVYTFSDNRMWRKNRNENYSTTCNPWNDDLSNGVDLNRNFGFHWMGVGASSNPCAETFAGGEPFSEPEAQAISEYVTSLHDKGKFVYYITFHSFSQMVLIPYSHVSGIDVLQVENYGNLFEIAIRGMDKLKERFGTEYIVGTSQEILYATTGSSFDWVKGVAEVPIVYLFELRDNGTYGFLLPPELIIPNNLEIMDALIEMDKVTRQLGYYSGSILMDLQKQGDVEFWTDIVLLGEDVRIMVSPEVEEDFVLYTKAVGLNAELRIPNVQELIDAQLRPASIQGRNSGSFNWTQYHDLAAIHAWLDELGETYPNIVTVLVIGQSNEGRDIKGVKIDFRPENRGENPLIGMLEGGIHAREWISPATLTWVINEFLTSTDPDVRFMAETFVWHIFPVTNPDGYEYTYTDDRMWRKNRNPVNFTTCSNRDDLSNGIDLNRNFDFRWMGTGASANPCDQTFAGPSAASEPETKAITEYLLSLKTQGNVIYYIAFHSFSQMILIPYSHASGYDVLEVGNYGDLFEIAIRGAEKLKARHGTEYRVGTSAEILYVVSGSSFDWVKGVADIPIVYLFELRDLGYEGFLLSPEFIIPNNEEVMDCLVEMDRTTRTIGYYSSASALINSFVLMIAGITFIGFMK
ncbi:Zinc carboxypeptidase A 1 [Eumeta japonica]|uniref:Zinc carboxypeptidase A 1 n=1 Tax=Eumeta variegata TaxID=151549 RepID=A0A4C1YV79_EUMVA|nr:Zinc carboxypeptidase A 1 [Eumeta japonica]